MTPATALEKAREIKPSQKSTAAHLYNTIEWELNHIETELAGEGFSGPPSAAERTKLQQERRVYESALAVIEEKVSDAKSRADEIFTRPRSVSARAQRTIDHQDPEEDESSPASSDDESSSEDREGDRDRPGTALARRARSAVARRRAAGVPGRRARASRARYRAQRSSVRGPARAAKTVAYQLDSASGGWGSVAAYFLVGGVLLSILLLALRNTSSVARLETGITTAIGWVVNPAIDPLRPPGANRIPASRTAAPAPTPAGGFRP